MRGRRRYAGFTLVEALLASALLAFLVVILTDIFPDMLHINSRENLSYRVNWETQRLLQQLEEDIHNAGFRFLPPSTTDETGSRVNAIETPDRNFLILRGVSGLGQLAADANAGATVLSVAGFTDLTGAEYLVWSYMGNGGCLSVRGIGAGGSQVVVGNPGLPRGLPAGTPLLAVRRIEYQITGDVLIRRVNGIETHRVTIDPVSTGIQYTLQVPGTGNVLTQNLLTETDLNNLLFVNVSLALVRTVGISGGRNVRITGSARQQIAPLNLRELT